MINTYSNQSLDDSITRLITAYQQAMQQGDQSDFVTKAEVTHSVIDSGHAIANRLRTRVQGSDEQVQKLERYYQALNAEDWVEKSKSVITKAAAIMGVTAAVLVTLALSLFSLLSALFNGSVTVGANLMPILVRYLLAYPGLSILALRNLRDAFKDFSIESTTPPSVATIILSRTVDPTEQQVYALIGGSRPVRTFERLKQGGAIIVGVIVFVVASGFLLGVLLPFLEVLLPLVTNASKLGN